MSLAQTQIQSVSCDEQILSCVDKGLESVGRNVRNVVYWHLQKLGSIKRIDIPEKPMMFVQGLRALYGESRNWSRKRDSTGDQHGLWFELFHGYRLGCCNLSGKKQDNCLRVRFFIRANKRFIVNPRLLTSRKTSSCLNRDVLPLIRFVLSE